MITRTANSFHGWYPEDPDLKREFIKYFRQRNQIIVWLKLAGWSFQQIGELMDLTKRYAAKIYDLSFKKSRKNLP